jgi:putative tryptophan/tyrosine transport system substrate-binding protein
MLPIPTRRMYSRRRRSRAGCWEYRYNPWRYGIRRNLDDALEAARQQHPDALVSVEDPFTATYRKRITDFAIAARLPSLYGLREDVNAGGLVSYGANLAELYRRAAGYVDKILKGAKPADLPVQQPTTFELVVNLKTARLLGLEVPSTLLARADEVIE